MNDCPLWSVRRSVMMTIRITFITRTDPDNYQLNVDWLVMIIWCRGSSFSPSVETRRTGRSWPTSTPCVCVTEQVLEALINIRRPRGVDVQWQMKPVQSVDELPVGWGSGVTTAGSCFTHECFCSSLICQLISLLISLVCNMLNNVEQGFVLRDPQFTVWGGKYSH